METTLISEVKSIAMDFDLAEIIDRYAEEQDIPTEVAYAHFAELRKYLILCALFPKKRYPMTMPIDNAWHTFLIFTEQYSRFCEAIAGRFIHHHPEKRNQVISDEFIDDKRLRFLAFKEDYKIIFGYEPPSELWPKLNKVRDVPTCHADNCSRCGGNECD